MSGPTALVRTIPLIRDYTPADAQAVLAINQANVPEVGSIDAERLGLFERISPFFKVVEITNAAGSLELVGLMIGLTEASTEYPSVNYAWFRDRHDSFAYVDRIAIVEGGRGQGWGPALYTEFERWAKENKQPWLCAEVNTVPDNPRSRRFHEVFGFDEVQLRRPYGPDEEVVMVEKQLPTSGSGEAE